MRVKFWGVRGTIPTPGPTTVKYGGKTLCIEVVTDDGQIIILDAGTGIRDLGMALAGKSPFDCSLFISHTHWDHIQGIPFFVPLFIEGNKIDIYGSYDPIHGKSFRQILDVLMQFEYFPVRFDELKSERHFYDLSINQTLRIGDTKITTYHMNHPILGLGYKIESGGKSLFYSGDYEPPTNIYSPDESEFIEYEEMVREQHRNLVDFLDGVDALIMDSTYTEEEYPTRVGWGHGTFSSSYQLACETSAKRLAFFHHDPGRTDDQLDDILTQFEERKHHEGRHDLVLQIARENEEFSI